VSSWIKIWKVFFFAFWGALELFGAIDQSFVLYWLNLPYHLDFLEGELDSEVTFKLISDAFVVEIVKRLRAFVAVISLRCFKIISLTFFVSVCLIFIAKVMLEWAVNDVLEPGGQFVLPIAHLWVNNFFEFDFELILVLIFKLFVSWVLLELDHFQKLLFNFLSFLKTMHVWDSKDDDQHLKLHQTIRHDAWWRQQVVVEVSNVVQGSQHNQHRFG